MAKEAPNNPLTARVQKLEKALRQAREDMMWMMGGMLSNTWRENALVRKAIDACESALRETEGGRLTDGNR